MDYEKMWNELKSVLENRVNRKIKEDISDYWKKVFENQNHNLKIVLGLMKRIENGEEIIDTEL